MTPSIRANGPSYMKPVPPPISRSANHPKLDAPPIVIVRTIANRQVILAHNTAAGAFGIRAGLTLTEASALCASLTHFEHDPLRDARALEALARWMMRYTPIVSVGATLVSPSSDQDKSDASVAPTCIFLDVTGCSRAFHGLDNIITDLTDSLRRLRLSASIAIAPTPAAALALASFPIQNPKSKIQNPTDLPAALAPLPIDALHLDDEITASLHHLGLETIGHLMNLPRAALPARFGPTLLLRLDQALGRIDEPLVPLVYHAPLEARIDFDGAVDSLETIYLVFKNLIGEIVGELTRRGAGVRELTIEFFRPYAQTIAHTIRLSRPSRDPVNLFNLIRCACENLDGEDCGDGFLGIRLHVPRCERIRDEQIALLDHERYAGEIKLAQLIERLCVRMGDDAIVQPVLAESHLPERAWSSRSMAVSAMSKEPHGRDAHATCCRPLHLLKAPIEIAVMVSPSDDRNGRPILFRHQNNVHELTQAIGPERIAGEWWRGHDRTRDYFEVEDEQGKRFWLFRVQETSKWYLHGLFN